jgi:hypothetical protein
VPALLFGWAGPRRHPVGIPLDLHPEMWLCG